MKLFLSFVMLLTTSCCFARDQVDVLAKAIGKAEGFGVPRTIPTRCHNPGDIKALRGYKFPGQRGVKIQRGGL